MVVVLEITFSFSLFINFRLKSEYYWSQFIKFGVESPLMVKFTFLFKRI